MRHTYIVRLAVVLVSAALLAAVATTGGGASASHEDPNIIHGCAKAKTGGLRVVGDPLECKNNEFSLLWNVQGLEGPPGPPGPPGETINYAAGDGLTLTGTRFDVVFGGTGDDREVSRSDHNHDSTYWKLTGNGGTSAGTNFLGTTDNQPLEIKVNNERVFRFEPGSSPNLIGGWSLNSATQGVIGASVSGGGGHVFGADQPNRVTDDFGTVGGGYGNTAGDDSGQTNNIPYATVGGGRLNTASGVTSTVGGGENNLASAWRSLVSGGEDNVAGGIASTVSGGLENEATGDQSFVGGGQDNLASQQYAAVGGGSSNAATAVFATVPGGNNNMAAGHSSFAAGTASTVDAQHHGTFLWSDRNSRGVGLASATANEFAALATGGVRFLTGLDASGNITAGVKLNAGSSSWSTVSDRAAKANFAPVDGRAVLEALASIPIESWNWKAQDPSIRHIGPMAQDFYAAFGMGEDPTRISTVDADGVALAAIQGLVDEIQIRDARIDRLEDRVSALERPTSSEGAVPTWLLWGVVLLALYAAAGKQVDRLIMR